MWKFHYILIEAKVKQSLCSEHCKRLRLQNFKKSAHDDGKVVSHTHRPPFPPQEIFLIIISVGGTMVRLSAILTGHLYPPGNIPDNYFCWRDDGKVVSHTHRPPLPPGNIPDDHFCWRLSQLLCHSAAGRIMSVTTSGNTIGNRTLDLSACSAVPQATAPPRAP